MCLFYLQGHLLSIFVFIIYFLILSGIAKPPVVPVWQALLPVFLI